MDKLHIDEILALLSTHFSNGRIEANNIFKELDRLIVPLQSKTETVQNASLTQSRIKIDDRFILLKTKYATENSIFKKTEIKARDGSFSSSQTTQNEKIIEETFYLKGKKASRFIRIPTDKYGDITIIDDEDLVTYDSKRTESTPIFDKEGKQIGIRTIFKIDSRYQGEFKPIQYKEEFFPISDKPALLYETFIEYDVDGYTIKKAFVMENNKLSQQLEQKNIKDIELCYVDEESNLYTNRIEPGCGIIVVGGSNHYSSPQLLYSIGAEPGGYDHYGENNYLHDSYETKSPFEKLLNQKINVDWHKTNDYFTTKYEEYDWIFINLNRNLFKEVSYY